MIHLESFIIRIIRREDLAGGELIPAVLENSKFEIPSKSAAPKVGQAGRRNSELLVRLSEPVRGVAPGQAAVLYQGDECVGGGVIDSA